MLGRIAFVLSLSINAGLLGFLLTAMLATALLDPGEEQIGWGLFWYFSLPAVVILAISSLFAYPKYLELPGKQRLGLYLALLASITAMAPAVLLLFASCAAP